MSVIELEHATSRIGRPPSCSTASFAIEPGEFIGVLGPNGAGKTTLMRAILGLLPPSAGAVRVFGRRAAARRSGDRLSAAGAHGAARSARARPRFHRARRSTASAGACPRSLPPTAAPIDATLDLVGARDLAGRALSDMSGGERQRLLLAQALIGEPKLLLLDEPLISLDARHQEVVDRRGAQGLPRARDHRAVQRARAQPALGTLDRVLYLGNGQAVLGAVDEVDHRAGAVAALRRRDRGGARRRAHLRDVARPRRRARRACARPRARPRSRHHHH